ncbi:MAG TPA: adenylate/guanylate cyclase domain-containing protein [Stellaceae bacterium]|jgi:adenylate cyclase
MRVPVPIRGPLALPLRLVGIKRSRMNPNLCTICELMFTRVMRRRNIEVDLTVLFADLRGYTALSQSLDRERVAEILNIFYDECAAAIWAEDGILNKTLGDAVMAIFNFPVPHADHARRAVRVARDIQRRCAERGKRMAGRETMEAGDLRVGIGVHTGLAAFGEFGGTVHTDLTAVGTVVNLAARLQNVAAAGEIVVTRQVVDALGGEWETAEGHQTRECTLKGFAEPMTAYLM